MIAKFRLQLTISQNVDNSSGLVSASGVCHRHSRN
ncbi:hypothetical protein ACFU51_06045 [Streptomyces sp. NPDC057430]